MNYDVKIGAVKLSNPFVLAPLAGISNWPFRKLAKQYGASLTVTEMVSAVALSFKGRRTMSLLDREPEIETPFCAQLFGKDPQRLGLGAKVAQDMGADIIDINLGCPARKVIKSGSGAALLKDFALIREILKAVVGSVTIPVTVKTRPGFTKSQTTIFDLLPMLVEEGISAVTLHPRYAEAPFSGEADWDMVGRLAEISPIPVIGSGDIHSGQDAVDKLNTYKPQAVMIGRGAKGQPWIFREALEIWQGRNLTPLSYEERFRTAAQHARCLAQVMGLEKAPFLLRSVLMWYTKGLEGASEFRRRLCMETDLEKQLTLLEECFSQAKAAREILAAEFSTINNITGA